MFRAWATGAGMLILKRRPVWGLETLVLVVLLTAYGYASAVVILNWLEGTEFEFPSLGEPYALLLLAAAIVTVFISTGYFLTTAVFMLTMKRLAVWGLETLVLVVLLAAFVFVWGALWSGDAAGEFFDGLRRAFLLVALVIITVLFSTGYLLATAIFGVVWRSQRLWLYPTVAAVLFLAPVQWYFIEAGPGPTLERWSFQLGGMCIVFIVTSVGNLVLRRW